MIELLLEKPREQIRFIERLAPGKVSQALVFRVVRVTSRLGHGSDHIATATDWNDRIVCRVKGPNGNLSYLGIHGAFIPTSAPKDARSKTIRKPAHAIPHAITAHRNSDRIGAVPIDAELRGDGVENLQSELHRLAGLGRTHTRGSPPRHVDPLLPFRTLGHNDEAGMLGLKIR